MRLFRVSSPLPCSPILIWAGICLFIFSLYEYLDTNQFQHGSKTTSRVLSRRLMDHDHTFIPANDSLFNYSGRWVSSARVLRREAGFPGSYISFTIENSSSIYVALRNTPLQTRLVSKPLEYFYQQQITLTPLSDNTPASTPVDLLVVIDEKYHVSFNGTKQGILRAHTRLDSAVSHNVRIIHLGDNTGNGGVMEFEGIWIDNGGYLQPIRESGHAPSSSGPKTWIEIHTVTEELNYMKHGTQVWPLLLSNRFSIEHSLIHLPPICLTNQCSQSLTVQNSIFRAGPPGTTLFHRPWTSKNDSPSLLILQLGLPDIISFLSDPTRATKSHSITNFITDFTNTFANLIKTIRATNTIPPNSPSELSSSYMYNSAPPLQQIILLPAFHPNRTVQRLLSHCLQQTALTRRQAGDLRVFALDTSDWLSPHDFQDTQLTPAAHRKVAEYIGLHLCAYLSSEPEQNCAFPTKRDVYTGMMVWRAELDMRRHVEEKKIERLMAGFGCENEGHDSVEWREQDK